MTEKQIAHRIQTFVETFVETFDEEAQKKYAEAVKVACACIGDSGVTDEQAADVLRPLVNDAAEVTEDYDVRAEPLFLVEAAFDLAALDGVHRALAGDRTALVQLLLHKA